MLTNNIVLKVIYSFTNCAPDILGQSTNDCTNFFSINFLIVLNKVCELWKTLYFGELNNNVL